MFISDDAIALLESMYDGRIIEDTLEISGLTEELLEPDLIKVSQQMNKYENALAFDLSHYQITQAGKAFIDHWRREQRELTRVRKDALIARIVSLISLGLSAAAILISLGIIKPLP